MDYYKFLAVPLIAGTVILGSLCEVNAEEIVSDDEKALNEGISEGKKTGRDLEIQLEFLSGNCFGKHRKVDNYNVHLFEKVKTMKHFSFYRGLTFTRATGYTNPLPYTNVHHNSDGFGIGPAVMARYSRQVSGKFHMGWDFTGSLMIYNNAHPYRGRAYGFLWRTGPRLTWQYDKESSFNVGYAVSHFSNGLRSHNPGYNGGGVSVGLTHTF